MSSKISTPVPIEITPGVQPIPDSTRVATNHYTYSQGIRFKNGVPEKIGGNLAIDFDYGDTINGTVRSIFSSIINGKYYALFGSNTRLYSLIGSRLTNITPFLTTSTAAANSLSTQYNTLSNNPFTSTLNSSTLTVQDAQASRLIPGDTVTFSGSGGFAGISSGDINTSHLVRSVDSLGGTYTINVSTLATSATTGGGASVVRSTGLINLNSAAHGLSNGDRIKISGAANTGGILAAAINLEFIIRNVATDSFDFMTAGTATSSVTAAGGAATVYYKPIPAGNLDEQATQGYGAGLYGAGLYGTALVSPSARSFPRIWFFDRYANSFIMTPGNQTGVYQWLASNSVAPTLVTNAPTAVNYAFVASNILVTLGAGGVENRIFASDQNNITQWTSSSTNQVFDDDVEGAGRLLSHCPAESLNLLYTENKTYTFRYIGLPLVWEILPLDESIGIIAPMARVPAKGMAFWMGQENFYMYRGGKIEIIPANSQAQCTSLEYVFGNLNYGQKSKIFAWYNKAFNEVWFHYPSASSNDPDRVVKVNLLDYTWSIDLWPRTAAEYPAVTQKNPLLANVNIIYRHELGTDNNGQPLFWTLTSNRRYYGKDSVVLTGVIPDSVETGDIQFNASGVLYSQSVNKTYDQTFPITPTTENVPITGSFRFMEYTWSSNILGQDWQMGQWYENIQKGATQT